MIRKNDQRRAEGKRTVFIYQGQLVSDDKLARSRKRFEEQLATEAQSPVVCRYTPE